MAIFKYSPALYNLESWHSVDQTVILCLGLNNSSKYLSVAYSQACDGEDEGC